MAELLVQLDARRAGQSHVEHQAVRVAGAIVHEQRLGTVVGARTVARGPQPPLQRLPHADVVLDHHDQLLCAIHG